MKKANVIFTSLVLTASVLAGVAYIQNQGVEKSKIWDEVILGGVVETPDTDMGELTGEDENEETTINEEQPEEQEPVEDEESPEPESGEESQEPVEDTPESQLPEEPETSEEENNEHSSPSTPMCGEEEHYDTETHQCESNMLENQTCEFQFPGSVEDYYNYDDSETYTSIYSGGEWVKEKCRILGCKEGYQFNEVGECEKEELEEVLESPSAGGQTLTTYAGTISYGTTTKTATLTGDSGTMNNFTYKTITVGDYVLMDRNLGATEEWTYDSEWSGKYSTPIASYGYYYQWGNNYGFSPATTAAGASSAITVGSEYMPSKYSSPNWNTAQPWSTQNNLWGNDTNTTIARQGPCPYGWHVPSNTGWQNIYNAWSSSSDRSGSTPKDFAKDLKLPPAGFRNYSNLSFYGLGRYGDYWSSTPRYSDYAYNLYFNASNIDPSYDYNRSYGLPVRCLQSFPTQTLTFHADQGTIDPESVTVEKGTTTTAPTATNENADSVTWYTESTLENEFDFSAAINADYNLYAKWECKEGYMTNDNGKTCEVIPPVIYGTTEYTATLEGNGGDEMNTFKYKTLKVGNYTLMDRNLGATTGWNKAWSSSYLDSYGYYYQWGNNYGFKYGVTPTTSSTQVAATMNSTYSSSTWITTNPWNSGATATDALWGHQGTQKDMQGPCPSGWRLPTKDDWIAITEAWCTAAKGDTSCTKGNEFAEALLLPPAGRRQDNDLSFGALGFDGRFWSSTPSDSNSAYALYIYSSAYRTNQSFSRSYAGSVRCLKSFPTQTLTFHANGGTMSETTKEVDKGTTTTAPAAPTRDNSNFIGWYTDEGLTQAFSFSTPINEDLDLYAKYTCEGGYVEAEDHQSCIDNTPPTISFTDDVGSTYVRMDTIIVNWGDAVVKKYMLADSECSLNANDYTATNEVNLSIAGTELYNGKYLCLYAEDEVGNSVILKSENTIHIDMTAPTGTISINNNASYTNDVNVTLTLTAVDTGSSMGQMKFSCNGATWSDWEDYNTTKSWNLTSGNGCELGDGEKIVRVRFKDLAGNISAESTSIILVDTVAPTGSISLDNGAQYTNNSLGKVSITLSASDEGAGMGQMQFSCDNSTWSNPMALKTSEKWTFQSGYGCNASEGEKTLYVRYIDNAGNTATFSDSIIYDKTAPTGSITINNGAEYTNNNQVSIKMIASDGGSGMGKMHFSCNGTNWTDLANYHENDTWTFASFGASLGCDGLEGEKTLYVEYQDNAGNTATFSDSIIYDKTAPALEFTNDVSADYVRFDEVVVNWGDATVKKWRYSESSTCSTTESDYDKTDSDEMGQITEANNGKYICLYAKDAAGNASTKASTNTFHIDATAPTGTISINNNANYTNDANVTLTLAAVDTGSLMGQMRFSCNGVTWSSWETYTTSKNWNLNTGNGCTSGDGEKTVNVQYKDNVGNIASFSDSIILDTVGPVLEFTNDVSAEYVRYDEVYVNWGDATVKKWRYSESSTCSTTESDYDKTDTDEMGQITEANNGKYICLYAKDGAGNVSRKSSASTFHIDETSPTGTISINNNASYTNDANVTLTLTAVDTGSSMGQMRFSCNGATWSSWEDFNTTKSWNLTAGNGCESGDGNKSVSVQYKDNVGNMVKISDTITLDTTKPTSQIVTTRNLKAVNQSVEYSCSDTNGIKSYYWGTKSSPQDTDYQQLAATAITYNGNETVTSPGIYYFFCKDSVGNVSNGEAETYYTYEVHNMLNAFDKNEGTYNTTNYPQVSTNTYLAPTGTSIVFKNVYTIPNYSSEGKYVGYTTSNNGTPLQTENKELTGNAVYYFRFNRNTYKLSLVKSTGIANIYYQVNGATEYTSVSSSTTVDMKAGSTAKVYAEASAGYTHTATNSTSPIEWSDVNANKEFAPTATLNTYTITYVLGGGINHEENPATYNYLSSEIILKSPTRNGFVFKGWKEGSSTTVQTTMTIPTHSTGNRTYTAVWAKLQAINYVDGNGETQVIELAEGEDVISVLPTSLTRAGYVFDGWDGIPADGKMPEGGLTLTPKWIPNTYTVNFAANGGTGTMENQIFTYGTAQKLRKNTYTNSGYRFNGWSYNGGVYTDEQEVLNLVTSGTISLIAQWNEIVNQLTGGSSGGGGRSISSTTNTNTPSEEHNAAEEKQTHEKENQTRISNSKVQLSNYYNYISNEDNEAYTWARDNNITTLPPEESNPNGYVKRGEMAKMVVNFALNVLGEKLPESYPEECTWSDNLKDWDSKELKDYASKACALGIMGINTKYFNPKKEVTRAQFGTILSRMLWGNDFNIKDSKENPYYTDHLKALKANGIMDIISNPTKTKEVRKWVWIMMQRANKNKK